jgi:hypothetical protein
MFPSRDERNARQYLHNKLDGLSSDSRGVRNLTDENDQWKAVDRKRPV